ncbi:MULTISPECIES: exonuclease domain-containing protein [unclassified Anabaena]|jgi:DNA polymerase III epsilon subunit-like protein|uniref:exonuclease domain-containing protein n=1 Tax=unclassified Anabaena TaxID=2619674 RepID=UPI0006AC2240|nr:MULTISPECIES: exonuclease domain-containing protein [unclassified Anabaena]ALB41306.1 exonuclease [Anabaena sp. WA102]OBQ16381.1 MAG: exonuclease [Anabaena sp. AL93]
MDFVILDTEGNPNLTELAIVNSQGVVIYEGFCDGNSHGFQNVLNLKSLKTLLTDFLTIVEDKKIICHYAEHDIDILKHSFRQVGLPWHNLEFDCTWILAKDCFPNLESYSLEYLSKYLNLRANNQYFLPNMAHTASYDATFTYHLYRKIMLEHLKKQPNPFTSSRVDTPFQHHPDYADTYHREFQILQTSLNNIKLDPNHQSKGVVVIGEPGTGKTHLMMRLANERLSSNRLLFVRQPNNAQSVLYHIYSRILESLVEKAGNLPQLYSLIINTFRKIVSLNDRDVTQKDIDILKALYDLEDNSISALSKENTQRKREYWQYIEKTINEWWMSNYAPGSFALSIIKGMVKYCSYTDYKYRNISTRWLAGNVLTDEESETVGLPNWGEEISKEAFSLEAISVLGKLSILDEPLIIIFDQLEGLGLPHNQEILLNFGEGIKEIFTHVPNSLIILNLFPDRWEKFQTIFDQSIIGRVAQYQVSLRQPTEAEVKSILKVKIQTVDITLEQLFLPEDLDDILGKKPIRAALNRAAKYYDHRVNGISLPDERKPIRELDGNEKIEQQLKFLQQQQQTSMEVLSQLIQAIQSPNAVDLSNLQNKLATYLSGETTIPVNPLIEYLNEHRIELEQKYHNPSIISDGDDVGKLKNIAEALTHIQSFKLSQYRLGKKVLPEHIVIEKGNQYHVIAFLEISGTPFTSRISNFNELVINNSQSQFYLIRDERQPGITAKVGKERIKQLENSANGNFMLFNKEDRILFDLIYDLIISIHNKDLDIDLESALTFVTTHQEWYHWIFTKFGFTLPKQ